MRFNKYIKRKWHWTWFIAAGVSVTAIAVFVVTETSNMRMHGRAKSDINDSIEVLSSVTTSLLSNLSDVDRIRQAAMSANSSIDLASNLLRSGFSNVVSNRVVDGRATSSGQKDKPADADKR